MLSIPCRQDCTFFRLESRRRQQNRWNADMISYDNLERCFGKDLQIVATCFWMSASCWSSLLLPAPNKDACILALLRMNSALFHILQYPYLRRNVVNNIFERLNSALKGATVILQRTVFTFSSLNYGCSSKSPEPVLSKDLIMSVRNTAFAFFKVSTSFVLLFDCKSFREYRPGTRSALFGTIFLIRQGWHRKLGGDPPDSQ